MMMHYVMFILIFLINLIACDDQELRELDVAIPDMMILPDAEISICGNGILEVYELCDDGNTLDNDGCTNQCKIASCGDGITREDISEGEIGYEACDNGEENNNDTADACRSDCSLPRCGDQVIDEGETCDDGNIIDDDGCLTSCVVATCNDGVLRTDLAEGEEGYELCDDGDDNSNELADRCRTNCTLFSCGDEVKDSNEECDDGNLDDHDGCSATCVLEVCGDGVLRTGLMLGDEGYEECDQGTNNSDQRADACRSTCLAAYCGDRIVDSNETCDDGNLEDHDGCSAVCAIEACGDGIKQRNEACDDGNHENGDGCDAHCIIESCGNGVLQFAEECDEGVANSNNTADTCRENCMLPSCGDQTTDSNEQCDGEETCDASCIRIECGNDRLQADEDCDDGDDNNADHCTNLCTLARCGDDILRQDLIFGLVGYEACDDGNLDNGDGCDNECMQERCGNAFIQSHLGETCDDGNLDNGDGCDDSCYLETCGNSIHQAHLGEQCDDGNTIDDDDCSNTCILNLCGNAVLDEHEECDPALQDECDEGCTFSQYSLLKERSDLVNDTNGMLINKLTTQSRFIPRGGNDSYVFWLKSYATLMIRLYDDQARGEPCALNRSAEIKLEHITAVGSNNNRSLQAETIKTNVGPSESFSCASLVETDLPAGMYRLTIRGNLEAQTNTDRASQEISYQMLAHISHRFATTEQVVVPSLNTKTDFNQQFNNFEQSLFNYSEDALNSMDSYYHVKLATEDFNLNTNGEGYEPQQLSIILRQQNIKPEEYCAQQALQELNDECRAIPSSPDLCPTLTLHVWNQINDIEQVDESSVNRIFTLAATEVSGLGCMYTNEALWPGLYQVQVSSELQNRFEMSLQLSSRTSSCGNFVLDAGEECDLGSNSDTNSYCRQCMFTSINTDNDTLCDRNEQSTDCIFSQIHESIHIVNQRQSASFVDRQVLKKTQNYFYAFRVHDHVQRVDIDLSQCSSDNDGVNLRLYQVNEEDDFNEYLTDTAEVMPFQARSEIDLDALNLIAQRGRCAALSETLTKGAYVIVLSNNAEDSNPNIPGIFVDDKYAYQIVMKRVHQLQAGLAHGYGLVFDNEDDLENQAVILQEVEPLPVNAVRNTISVTYDDHWNDYFQLDLTEDQQVALHIYDDILYRQCESRRDFTIAIYSYDEGILHRNHDLTLTPLHTVSSNDLQDRNSVDPLIANLNTPKPCFKKIIPQLLAGSYLIAVKQETLPQSFLWSNEPYILQIYQPSLCGNNVQDDSEECDDGNTSPGDGCSKECFIESICGNGEIEATEVCDDGNLINGDFTCSSLCTLCGNGLIDEGEECDDGNGVHNDECNQSCQFTRREIHSSIFTTHDDESLSYVYTADVEQEEAGAGEEDFCLTPLGEDDPIDRIDLRTIDTNLYQGNEKHYRLTVPPRASLQVHLCTQLKEEEMIEQWGVDDLKVKLHLYPVHDDTLSTCIPPHMTDMPTYTALQKCLNVTGETTTDDELSHLAEIDRPLLKLEPVVATNLESCVVYQWDLLNDSDVERIFTLHAMPQLKEAQQNVFRSPKISYKMSWKVWRNVDQSWEISDLPSSIANDRAISDLTQSEYARLIGRHSNLNNESFAQGEDTLYKLTVDQASSFELRTFESSDTMSIVNPFLCPLNTSTQIIAYEHMIDSDNAVHCQDQYQLNHERCDWNRWNLQTGEYFFYIREIDRASTTVNDTHFTTQIRNIDINDGCGNGVKDRGEECDFALDSLNCTKNCHCTYGYVYPLEGIQEVSEIDTVSICRTGDADAVDNE